MPCRVLECYNKLLGQYHANKHKKVNIKLLWDIDVENVTLEFQNAVIGL